MHLNGGKRLNCHLKGKTCREWANGLKIHDSLKKWTPGVSLLHQGHYTVFYKNIQFEKSLKPLGQSKPNFI